MSIKMNLTKAIGLGIVVTALTAGTAFAAVATSSANVRSGPGTNFHRVDRIHAGDYVRITDHEGSWCEISGDADGWVKCGILANSRTNDYPKHRYNPYRHGGYGGYDGYNGYNGYNSGPSVSIGVGPHGPSFGFSTGPSW